jgi:hypothetical protein
MVTSICQLDSLWKFEEKREVISIVVLMFLFPCQSTQDQFLQFRESMILEEWKMYDNIDPCARV